jgi:hypothetical protein
MENDGRETAEATIHMLLDGANFRASLGKNADITHVSRNYATKLYTEEIKDKTRSVAETLRRTDNSFRIIILEPHTLAEETRKFFEDLKKFGVEIHELEPGNEWLPHFFVVGNSLVRLTHDPAQNKALVMLNSKPLGKELVEFADRALEGKLKEAA